MAITLRFKRRLPSQISGTAGTKRKHAASDTDTDSDAEHAVGSGSGSDAPTRRPKSSAVLTALKDDDFVRQAHMDLQVPGDHAQLVQALKERALKLKTIDNHWPFCQNPECRKPPTLASQRSMHLKGVHQTFPLSEARPEELSKLGGWLRCTECTAALHYRCLDHKRQKAVLKDLNAEREEEAGKGRKPIPWGELPASEVREDIPCMTCYSEPALCHLCGLDPVGRTARQADEIWGAESDDDVSELGDYARPVFRCRQCKRPAHYECLAKVYEGVSGSEHAASFRAQLLEDWYCPDCFRWPAVEQVLAWRPAASKKAAKIREMNYAESRDTLDRYTREYLVKFQNLSWRAVAWVPHLWLVPTNPTPLKLFENGTQTFHPDRIWYTPAIPDWSRDQYTAIANADQWELLEHDASKPWEQYSGDNVPHPSVGEPETGTKPKKGIAMIASGDARIPSSWKTPERVLDVFYRPTVVESTDLADDAVRLTEQSLDDLGKRAIGLPPLPICGLVHIAQLDGTRLLDPIKAEATIAHVAWALVKWEGLEYSKASWVEVTSSSLEDAVYAQRLLEAYYYHLNARDVLVRKSHPEQEKITGDDAAGLGLRNDLTGLRTLAWYQQYAVQILAHNWEQGQSTLLTDDMGMGKTVEILEFMARLYTVRQASPFLILVPRHTIKHWVKTLRIWLPAANTVALEGPELSHEVLAQYEVFHSASSGINAVPGMTNLKAEVVVADVDDLACFGALRLRTTQWKLVVAHASICKTENKDAVALLQNSPRVVFNDTFLPSSYLTCVLELVVSSASTLYQPSAPGSEGAGQLEKKLEPNWLRHSRRDLLPDSKMSITELVVSSGLQAIQKTVHRAIVNRRLAQIKQLCSSEARSKPEDTAQNMRSILFELLGVYQNSFSCGDKQVNPDHIPNPSVAQLLQGSAKLMLLRQLLRQLGREGHRTVVVTPRTMDLDVIEELMLEDRYDYLRIDRNCREDDIDLVQRAWNQEGATYPVLLLHSLVGSADMNLLAADTMIFYGYDLAPITSWFNLGYVWRYRQKKALLVLNLVTKDSAESHLLSWTQRELARPALARSLDAFPLDELEKALKKAYRGQREGQADVAYSDEDVVRLLSLRGKAHTGEDIPADLRGRVAPVVHDAPGTSSVAVAPSETTRP